MMSAVDYLRHLQALLPRGPAWPREDDTGLTALLHGLAEEFARVDRRAADLLTEADPRTASELLADWERVVGLPDPCRGTPATLEERRAAVVGRLVNRSDQSPHFYHRLAETLGYTGVQIIEFGPFECDSSCAEDTSCDDAALWRYVWEVRADGLDFSTRPFRAGRSAAGEPLRDWGYNLLVCVLNKMRPSHTLIFYETGV
jgi:uncharacterized protein YmfQ (DUF2313 family)